MSQYPNEYCNFGRQLFKIATPQPVFDYMLEENMKNHYMLNENVAERSVSGGRQNQSKKFALICDIGIRKHWRGFKILASKFL